ncbi:rhomboid family intramembrane serine protease [Paracoccaceae bacterium GXU_MW_L88]
MAQRAYDSIRGSSLIADLGPPRARNAIFWIALACVLIEAAVIFYGATTVNAQLGDRYGLMTSIDVAHGIAAERYGLSPAGLLLELPEMPGHEDTGLSGIARLFSYQFIHGGVLHLVMNMIAMIYLGPPVLRRLGSQRFVLFYLICGIAGALTYAVPRAIPAMMGDAPMEGFFSLEELTIPLVGASGSIFGVWLANLRITWDRLRRMPAHLQPESPAKYMRKILVMIVVVNLGFVLIPTGIAGEAHIGGAVAGFLLYPMFAAGQVRYRARLESYVQKPLKLSVG